MLADIRWTLGLGSNTDIKLFKIKEVVYISDAENISDDVIEIEPPGTDATFQIDEVYVYSNNPNAVSGQKYNIQVIAVDTSDNQSIALLDPTAQITYLPE